MSRFALLAPKNFFFYFRTYEFESPQSHDSPDHSFSQIQRPFMNWRRKGKNIGLGEEADDSVYNINIHI